jgi:hypothetical protein
MFDILLYVCVCNTRDLIRLMTEKLFWTIIGSLDTLRRCKFGGLCIINMLILIGG